MTEDARENLSEPRPPGADERAPGDIGEDEEDEDVPEPKTDAVEEP